MFKKIFSLFAALTLSVGLWAANSVITFTSTGKLYPGDIMELMMDNSKWEAFKAQYPEFASMNPTELEMMGFGFFNPNAFLDANGQVLNYTYNYDKSTQIGTITFAGELVTITGYYTFSGGSSLTSITLPEGLTDIGEYSFYECRNLTTVNLPASLTTIGESAFDNCFGLTSVNFAAGSQLTTIGMYAFNGCSSLATITIPASVTNIGWVAFRLCGALTDVYVAWTTTLPTLGDDVFDDTPVSTATLHVPTGTTATYAAADQWKDFGNIVEPAPTPVPTTYIDENGETKNIDAWEVKDASEAVTWGTAGNTTWYVVKGTDVTLSKGAVCNGEVHLILADNAKLTATGGINVTGTNSLTIYGQSTGDEMGQLIADATSVGSAAGIGGGENGNGSNITINGGIVTATGGNEGAGIGGGQIGAGANITINGGKVTATGGIGAAGIGGGNFGAGSYITINGGEVTATGGDMAAGIGGGMYGDGSNITINGGEVTATGGEEAAGIGGGSSMNGSYITINGGIVTATGGTGYFGAGAGIGGGAEGSGSNIYISDAYILKAGATAEPTEVIAHSSAQDLGGTLTQQYAKIQGLAMPYTRSMTIDNWATVCLPYASTVFSGAKFYRVNYYDGDTKLYIEEVSSLVAGQPYIFQATDETVTIEHAGVATLTYGDEQKDRGLQGLFARTIIATDGSQAALSNNAVQWLDPDLDLEITVPACRAYFDMTEVPTTEQSHSAPLRCIRVPRQTPTDFENVTLDEDATKILRNGQLIIIRDGKEYNAQGMQL